MTPKGANRGTPKFTEGHKVDGRSLDRIMEPPLKLNAKPSSMKTSDESRREFIRTTGLTAGALLFSPKTLFAAGADTASDYTVHIKAAPVEIARDVILSTITYNGQFPGPLIRFKEGRPVTVDIFNDTDTPEQLHWHGQKISTNVDGSAE